LKWVLLIVRLSFRAIMRRFPRFLTASSRYAYSLVAKKDRLNGCSLVILGPAARQAGPPKAAKQSKPTFAYFPALRYDTDNKPTTENLP
jgi:hypothetical protein